MTTHRTICALEKQVKNVLLNIENCNNDRLHAVRTLECIDEELVSKHALLNDLNHSLEILRNAQSNT